MRRILLALGTVLFICGIRGPAYAQEFDRGVSERGPRFMVATGAGRAPIAVDARRVALLGRRVSVQLESATIESALNEISASAGMRLVYAESILPADIRVSLKAEDITVAAALTEVLFNIDVDVVISGQQVVLVKRVPRVEQQQPGTIVGTVTDAANKQPVVSAQVWVEGTRRNTMTDADGRYRLTEVEPGLRKVGVSIIGYKRLTHEIEISSGATVTADFALQVAPTALTEVVATVTGPQRRLELGHVVGRVNADSLVKAAPISTISQLLTGRVTGVAVNQSSGVVGGDVQLQVRTPNSILLGTQPIVIVDGVRYTNTAAFDPALNGSQNTTYGPAFTYSGGQYRQISRSRNSSVVGEVTSPLNDLNVNDIESIEVVKGSAAATLYGTDAANGVIVITTKRGRPGTTRWSAYVTSSVAEKPDVPVPERYFAYGTRPNGTPFGYTSGGKFTPQNCALDYVAQGICAQDSIVRYRDPNDDPSLTTFQSAPQWNYGLNVSGGTQDIRYYISGSIQDETGTSRMPRAFADSISKIRQLTDEQLRPNALRNINLRSNLTASFGNEIQLQGNLGYVRRTNRTNALGPGTDGRNAGIPLPNVPFNINMNPADVFQRTSGEQADRFLVSGRAEWRPVAWLRAHAGGGVDLSNQTRHSLERRGEVVMNNGSGQLSNGQVQLDMTQQLATTGDLGLTATVARGRLNARTSLGAQYTRNKNEVQQSWGSDLVPGGESVGQAAQRSTDHLFSESVTLGSYAEQTFGLNDRLFLTGALRMDGASNFGQKYASAVYPKASVSWLLSQEPFVPRIRGLNELRLRYAFGVSGHQAYSWMKLTDFGAATVVAEGALTPGIRMAALGNENLRPERSSEHEFGFDLAALDHRVQAGLAWYRRSVKDQILTQTLMPGFGSIFTNLGLATARGFEANLSAKILDTRMLSWDVTVLHSSSSTRVEDIGKAVAYASYLGSFREGFSLGARFQKVKLGFEDRNGDGIVQSSELLWTDTAVYVGETMPPRTQTLTTTFGMLNHRVRVSATFNRRAGHIGTPYNTDPCLQSTCLALLDPTTPVAEQAKFLGDWPPLPAIADETRFSELTLAADVPTATLSRFGFSSGTVSVSGRNLALWTRFPGDPGSVNVTGISTGLISFVPQGRTWTVRFDLGF